MSEMSEIEVIQDSNIIVESTIGSGTYGTVQVVVNSTKRTKMASKKIRNIFSSTSRALRAFRELKISCYIDHENLLAAVEVVQPVSLDSFKHLYIITDLMRRDLYTVSRSSEGLPADRSRLIFYQVMRGIKYLHSAKIVHRDIKPANILINENDEIKICDFGLARKVVPRFSRRRMTMDLGTHGYDAPEVFLKAEKYSTAVDIWAAACTLAEILGGRYLFDAKRELTHIKDIICIMGTPKLKDIPYAPEHIKAYISRAKPMKPRHHTFYELSANVTEDAVDLLSRMLHFNPAKRLSASKVLEHDYLNPGRSKYHSKLCTCCASKFNGKRVSAKNLEPSASKSYDDSWESSISNVDSAKVKMFRYICKLRKS